MKILAANIEDVMREAAARWTLVAYFFLSTIFIIIFASAINLDVVQGTLAGAKLFGNDVHMHANSDLNIERLVLGFESGFSAVLYVLSIFLAVFATAHLVPRLQDKGTIDLYLSRPVSRIRLLMSRYIAGLLLAASNVFYLLTAVWLIVIWKTHIVHPRFIAAGLLIMFVIATLLAFAFLVGTITSSTAVSIMATFGVALFSLPLVAHDRMAAAMSTEWRAWVINGLYWVIPKTTELGGAVMGYVGGEMIPERIRLVAWSAYATTAAFAVVCLALASWVFHRKEF